MLKDDPEMVKLIQNTRHANDGEQHKDNDNSTTKYLEFNMNSLLDLVEKNYENLVEALTNNTIDTSSSNPTLSLPSSTSSSYNQSDTYRIEETEPYHNSKGDIAD